MFRLIAVITMLVSFVPVSGVDGKELHVVIILIDGLPGYLLDDPRASMPEIRKLARDGVAADEGMTVSDPSMTWPNMTTLMSGCYSDRHGVLFNGAVERKGPGELVVYHPSRTQQELVRVPLLFDVLKQEGKTSAGINWTCTRGSTSIDDNFPDVPGALGYTTPRLKEELVRTKQIERFEKGNDVVQDEIWTDLACQVIRDRMPAFLALHLNNVDAAHHRYGPNSAPGYAAVALNDANVGRVLRALDRAGVREQTTVFIVADHGFIAVPKLLRPNAVLRREGLLTVKDGKIASGRVLAFPSGGCSIIFLTDPSTATQDREAVLRLFGQAEGIAGIIEPRDYPKYHLPSPMENRSMGDLVLVGKEGYSFDLGATGDALIVPNPNPTAGTHGFISTEPKMNAIFVASGAGIKAGQRVKTVANVDVAPTMARLLGVKLKDAAGRVIEECLGGTW